MPMASVYSLGDTRVVRLARVRVCGLFCVSLRWGGGTNHDCVCARSGGYYLENMVASYRYTSVMKD
jgi:hypothetical protein